MMTLLWQGIWNAGREEEDDLNVEISLKEDEGGLNIEMLLKEDEGDLIVVFWKWWFECCELIVVIRIWWFECGDISRDVWKEEGGDLNIELLVEKKVVIWMWWFEYGDLNVVQAAVS